MKKSLIKIISLLIIISLNWTGLSAILETFAYFSDTAISTNNIIQAGVLDMTLRSGQNNFVPGANNMKPGDQVNRDIYIGKTAFSLALRHNVSFEFISEDIDLCNQLDLKIWYDHYFGPPSGGYANRDMRLTYDGKLSALINYTHSDFEIPHPDDQFDTDPSDGTEQWFYYSIILPSNVADSFQGKVCHFNFVYEAWQTNLPDSSQGFTDTEEIESTIKTGYWNPPVVLNEFLPNPSGSEAFGEWVELYNLSDSDYNVAGWVLYDNNDKHDLVISNCHTNTGDTTIPAKGFLVVYRKTEPSCSSNFTLNNLSDTIRLYSDTIENGGVLIDSYTYDNKNLVEVEPTPAGPNDEPGNPTSNQVDKSYARYPDGTGPWIDPIPTPGAPNLLSEEEIRKLGLEENPLNQELTNELVEKPVEELVEEPISDEVEEPVVEEETVIEEEPLVEEVTTEENQEQGGIIEEINKIINEVIDEIVDEIISDEIINEPTEEAPVEETEAPVIEDVPIIEEVLVDETPGVEEQPAVVPDDSFSNPDGAGESVSDGGSGDGGGDTSGSLDNSSPAEGAGESSGDSGIDAGGEIVSE